MEIGEKLYFQVLLMRCFIHIYILTYYVPFKLFVTFSLLGIKKAFKKSYIYLKKSCRKPVWQIYVDTVYFGWEYLTYDMQGICTKHTRLNESQQQRERKLKTWLSCIKTCTFSVVIVSQGEADRWSELSISEHACQAHLVHPTQSNNVKKGIKWSWFLKSVLELKMCLHIYIISYSVIFLNGSWLIIRLISYSFDPSWIYLGHFTSQELLHFQFLNYLMLTHKLWLWAVYDAGYVNDFSRMSDSCRRALLCAESGHSFHWTENRLPCSFPQSWSSPALDWRLQTVSTLFCPHYFKADIDQHKNWN